MIISSVTSTSVKKFTTIGRIFELLKENELIFTPDGIQWQCDDETAVEKFISQNLTSEEKTKLTRILVKDYYSRDTQDPDESESYLNEVQAELEEFGLDTIGDVEDLVYSDNQKLFILDMLSQGVDVDPTYSGRGMYGRVCPSVRMDYEGEYPTSANVVVDSMGRGVVVYAQY
jgi:hypothetical protein